MTDNALTTQGDKALTIQGAGSDLMATINAGNNPWADMTKDLGTFFGSFMKINGSTGEVSYKDGEKEIEIDTPARFWVNVVSLTWGYNCWKEGERVDSSWDLWVNKQTVTPKGSLPDHGPYKDDDGWQEFYGLHMIYSPEDEDEPEVKLTYNAASGGAKRAVRMFMKNFAEKVRQHIDESNELPIPMIEITVSKFKTKDGKIIYSPNFAIVNWEKASEFVEDFSQEGEEDEDEDNYEGKTIDNDHEDTGRSGGEGGSDDASSYDDGDTTDIDESGDPVEEPKEEKPAGRGRGARGTGKAKTTAKQETKAPAETKPATSGGRGRGRRGK